MAYKTYNGIKLFSYDDSLDQPVQRQNSQPQQNSNPLGSFFNWIGDTAGAIGNTVKDTVGAVGSFFATDAANKTRENIVKANQEKLDNIAKKYGFNSYNEISDDAWENNNEMKEELKKASSENTKSLKDLGDAYKNNWAVKNTANVKQGDYGANAIKTWNTLADVLTAPVSMPASIALNAGQGYLSALGDELQGKDVVADPLGNGQAVNSSINLGNVAKQGTANALAGAAGAAAGGVTGKIGGKLAGSNNLLGKTAGTILNSNIGRGAISGAAGGATGAGAATAFEGGDLGQVLANAATGAQQGAGQGAVMSGAMSLGNRAINGIKNKVNGIEKSNVVEAPETRRTQTEATDKEMEQIFGTEGNKKIEKKNLLQKVGSDLENVSKSTKYGQLLGSLDKNTAKRAIETGAIDTLTDMGIKPRDYGAYAETSSYVNGVVDKLAKKSGVKVVDPELPTVLKNLPETSDIAMSETALKKYNQKIKSIMPDGNTPDEYSAATLLDLSRKFGNSAANITGNADDVKTLRTAFNEVKWKLRDAATEALKKAYITGDDTTAQIAKGLKDLGANQKVIDYYSAPGADGEAPTISDYIARSALFEQGREMSDQYNSMKFSKSANRNGIVNRILDNTGAGEVIDVAAQDLAAPIASGVTKLGGKIVGGLGKAVNKAENVTNRINQAIPTQTSQTNLPYALIGRLSGTEEGREAAQNPQTYANPTNLEQQLGNSAIMTGDTSYVGTANTGVGNYGGGMSTSSYGGGYSGTGNNMLDRLVGGMENALNAGDVAAFSQLADIYNTLSKVYGATSGSSTGSQKLSATQQRANAAMNSLQRLSSMTPDLGYNLSGIPVVGDIATLGGNAYEGEAKSLAQQIGYMVSGSNIKAEEAEAIGKAYVPQPFDSEYTRQLKLQRAAEIIQQYQNGTTDDTANIAYAY